MEASRDTGHFWLNKARDALTASGEERSFYRYNSRVAGWRALLPGARFVYYRPGEQVFFAHGTIGKVHRRAGVLGERFEAAFEEYHEFASPVDARSLKPRLERLRRREGLRGVPQNSITRISQEEWDIILSAAEASKNVEL